MATPPARGRPASTSASFDTWNAHASHGWSDDRGRDVFVSAARYDSHGPHALFFPEFAGEPGGGTVYDLDGDKSSKLFASARAGGLQVHTAFAEREKRVPTASWQTDLRRPAVLHARHARLGQRVVHARSGPHDGSGPRLRRSLQLLRRLPWRRPLVRRRRRRLAGRGVLGTPACRPARADGRCRSAHQPAREPGEWRRRVDVSRRSAVVARNRGLRAGRIRDDARA